MGKRRGLTLPYWTGALLILIGTAFASYAWPSIRASSQLMFELIKNLPLGSMTLYGAMMILSGFTLLIYRAPQKTPSLLQKFSNWGSLIGFTCIAILSLGILNQHFGSFNLAPEQSRDNILQIGGNIKVAGHVSGPVVALGGNITVEDTAHIDGPIISLLGNIITHETSLSDGQATTILGQLNAPLESNTDPSTPSTASALQPLLTLGQSNYWFSVYLAFLCTCAVLLYKSGHLKALRHSLRAHPGRHLSYGLLIGGTSLPLLLLGSLSAFSGTLSLLALLVLFSLMSFGLTLSLSTVGRAVVPKLKLPQTAFFEISTGLALFGLSSPLPLLATLLWGIGGALGLGAMLHHLLNGNRPQTHSV